MLVCQKLYHAPLLPSGFESGEIPAQNYPEKDFHEMYIGEILRALIAE